MVLCKLREVRSIRPGELDLIESVLSLTRSISFLENIPKTQHYLLTALSVL
jgi:hypothetical protein